ncbi:unnamed protein product [marine sediment metagenome]|uniref:Uncharacterized protein n=1 Tax=marine sediment metagenome TaxID=412755 RepID=X1FKN1_9ZZZZ
MELSKARDIAEEIMGLLEGSCDRKEIAGSIRRRKPCPGDIEILCIPKYDGAVDCLDRRIKELISQEMLDYRLKQTGPEGLRA